MITQSHATEIFNKIFNLSGHFIFTWLYKSSNSSIKLHSSGKYMTSSKRSLLVIIKTSSDILSLKIIGIAVISAISLNYI